MIPALALLTALAASPLEEQTEALVQKYFSVHPDGVLHLVPWSADLLAPIGAGEIAWFARVVDETAEAALVSSSGPNEVAEIIEFLRHEPRFVALFNAVRARLETARFALGVTVTPSRTKQGFELRVPFSTTGADTLAAGIVYPGDFQFSVGGARFFRCARYCALQLDGFPASQLKPLRRGVTRLELRWTGLGVADTGKEGADDVPVRRIDDARLVLVEHDRVLWPLPDTTGQTRHGND